MYDYMREIVILQLDQIDTKSITNSPMALILTPPYLPTAHPILPPPSDLDTPLPAYRSSYCAPPF